MTPEEFKRTFNLPFNESSRFFENKLNIPTEAWTDLWTVQHAKGFMVAGAYKADLLTDFRDAVQKAIDGQTTLKDFQGQFDTIVAKHGWDYNGSRNWRSSLIYNTNVRTSYMAGRWQQLTESGSMMPYLLYRHADGVMHPRPLHVSWSGIILPSDDPWWDTHYPPNGWGCHCTVFAASEQEYQAALASGMGTAPDDGSYDWANPATGEIIQVPNGIDPGWDYNVGTAAQHDYTVLADKLATLPPDIAAMLRDELTAQGIEVN
jgi:hypothetical protein